MNFGERTESVTPTQTHPTEGVPHDAGRGEREVLARRTVLIADDDQAVREALGDLLEGEGWDVALARNGREALKRVAIERPDLLILDHRMPHLTGAEVYRALRDNGIDVPVVLMTAASLADQLATSLGIIDVLRKPFSGADVVDVTERAMARVRAAS